MFQMLNSHSNVDIINELDLFYPHLEPPHRPEECAAFVSKVMDVPIVSPSDLPSQGLSKSGIFSILEAAFRHRSDQSGRRCWGIKDPHLTYVLDDFAAQYPSARFLFMLRDPRAVVNSYISRPFNVANCFHGAQLWSKEVRVQRQFREHHSERCLLVRYESLLQEKESTLQKVCDFAGLEFQESMNCYFAKSPKTRVHSGTENITRDVDPALSQKWRHELSHRQVQVIESVARQEIIANGYESTLSSRSIGSLERKSYDLHQWLITNWIWQKHTKFRRLRQTFGLTKAT